MKANVKAKAEHGIVCTMPGERFGYFGWPTVGRMDDGSLVVASSGLRTQHVCPWGKTVLCTSQDDGRSWSGPEVLNDTPLDDRDAGVICLGGKARLVSWFTSDTRQHEEGCKGWLGEEEVATWQPVLSTWTDELVAKWLGSWVRVSEDGTTWSDPIPVPVSAPHGPVRLSNGHLLYLGKACREKRCEGSGKSSSDYLQDTSIKAVRSTDGGKTWVELGTVPNCEGTSNGNFHEPHTAELPSGKLIGLIRYETGNPKDFSIYQTESEDGGETWTRSRPTGVLGSPPHVIRHSTGPLVCVYGYREKPFGQRAMISRDDGRTWKTDFIIRDDGPDWDLGYPSSVELEDGRIFTVCYQKVAAGEKPSLLWSCWRLPEDTF